MKIHTVEFVTSVFKLEQTPKPHLPEVVFFGRSNVGKSSLINCLLGRGIAKISQTPGKTQSLNYFLINSQFYFVDAPGFGYARVSKQLQSDWKELLGHWIKLTSAPRLAIHIIDSRLPPQPIDINMVEWLNHHKTPYFLVLNKTDLVRGQEKKHNINTLKTVFERQGSDIISFSAKTGIGKPVLLKLIQDYLSGAIISVKSQPISLSKGA